MLTYLGYVQPRGIRRVRSSLIVGRWEHQRDDVAQEAAGTMCPAETSTSERRSTERRTLVIRVTYTAFNADVGQ